LFSMPDEYRLLEFRALISKVRLSIQRKGMLLMDAFSAFDSDRNGLLTCSELYGGITWLGLELQPQNIHAIMRNSNTNPDHMGKHGYHPPWRHLQRSLPVLLVFFA